MPKGDDNKTLLKEGTVERKVFKSYAESEDRRLRCTLVEDLHKKGSCSKRKKKNHNKKWRERKSMTGKYA